MNKSIVLKRYAMNNNIWMMQLRYKYKQKWATNKKKKQPSEYALEHFDRYYGNLYSEKWPSMRMALLSYRKYCAMVNNFSNTKEVIENLNNLDTFDFVEYGLRKKALENIIGEDKIECIESEKIQEDNQTTYPTKKESTEIFRSVKTGSADLYDFMPIQTVHYLSEKDKMIEEEKRQNIYEAGNTQFNKFSFPELIFPHHLKGMVHDRGVISRFPAAQKDETGKIGYYLLDAASLLPVLALNLSPECSVLDLCAAPGGKSVAILQTMLPSILFCVDHSWSRLSRLKDVLRTYLPHSYIDEGRVHIMHGDGVHFALDTAKNMEFDRVLVDVPCFTDRHVLHENENNIFRPSRLQERLNIQQLQRDLLYAGILRCKPGGYIVYSTCTLSMPQNDGVIQRTLDKIWQETNINVVIKDTSAIASRFSDIFDFYDKTRFGQMVVPNVTANFGPIYFCTLQRVD